MVPSRIKPSFSAQSYANLNAYGYLTAWRVRSKLSAAPADNDDKDDGVDSDDDGSAVEDAVSGMPSFVHRMLMGAA